MQLLIMLAFALQSAIGPVVVDKSHERIEQTASFIALTGSWSGLVTVECRPLPGTRSFGVELNRKLSI